MNQHIHVFWNCLITHIWGPYNTIFAKCKEICLSWILMVVTTFIKSESLIGKMPFLKTLIQPSKCFRLYILHQLLGSRTSYRNWCYCKHIEYCGTVDLIFSCNKITMLSIEFFGLKVLFIVFYYYLFIYSLCCNRTLVGTLLKIKWTLLENNLDFTIQSKTPDLNTSPFFFHLILYLTPPPSKS